MKDTDMDWDIISGLDNFNSLIIFLKKYHKNINFNYKHDEYSKSTFEYTFNKIIKFEIENSSSLKEQYLPVIENILEHDINLFLNNYQAILKNDKDLFLNFYEKNNLNFQIATDPGFNFQQFKKSEKLSLIKNYGEFITYYTDNEILEYLIKNKKIDLYKTNLSVENSLTLGEQYLKDISSNFMNILNTNNLIESIISKLYIIKNNLIEDKNLFLNKSSFQDIINQTFIFNHKEINNIILDIYFKDNSYKNFNLDLLLDISDNPFFYNINFKNTNNCIEHFNFLHKLSEKQNNLNYIIENKDSLENLYKKNYPKVVEKIIKDSSFFSYDNMIQGILFKIVSNNDLFKSKTSQYLKIYSDYISKDKKLLQEIKNKFSLDYIKAELDIDKIKIVFKEDNFLNIILYDNENSNKQKYNFMLKFIESTTKADIELLKKNSPIFYKQNFINKNGVINKNPILKSTLEISLIKETINTDNVDCSKKQQKRL